MSKFITLVFRNDTKEQAEHARNAAISDDCTAWSKSDEILRLELIEQAIEDGDIDMAKSYIGAVDVHQFKDRLKSN